MLALFATFVMVTAVSTSFLTDDGAANGDSSFEEAFSNDAQRIIEGNAKLIGGTNYTISPDWNGVDHYKLTFSGAQHSQYTALSSSTSTKILKLTVGSQSITENITVSNSDISVSLSFNSGSSNQGTLSIVGSFSDVMKNPKVPLLGYSLSGSFSLTYDGSQPFADDIKLEIILTGLNGTIPVTNTITFTLKVIPGTHYFNQTNNMGLYPNADSTGIRIYVEDSESPWSFSNGTITSDFDSAASLNANANQNVLIALYPSDGKKVTSVSVRDGSGNELNCTKYINGVNGKDNTQNVWVFTMPDSDVTIDVVFDCHRVSIDAEYGSVTTKYDGSKGAK